MHACARGGERRVSAVGMPDDGDPPGVDRAGEIAAGFRQPLGVVDRPGDVPRTRDQSGPGLEPVALDVLGRDHDEAVRGEMLEQVAVPDGVRAEAVREDHERERAAIGVDRRVAVRTAGDGRNHACVPVRVLPLERVGQALRLPRHVGRGIPDPDAQRTARSVVGDRGAVADLRVAAGGVPGLHRFAPAVGRTAGTGAQEGDGERGRARDDGSVATSLGGAVRTGGCGFRCMHDAAHPR